MKTPVLLKRENLMSNSASADEYVKTGGYVAIKKAVQMTADEILSEVKMSKLLGRGGAAFPLEIKWKTMLNNPDFPKYIVCNADESDPGTFKDRKLLETDPHAVIEGLLIAAWLFKSEKSYIYIRGEYRVTQDKFIEALQSAEKAGFLGEDILGVKDFNHTINVISGSGAYVCGENSAILNSIEGKAGRPRIRPSHIMGLYGKPTLVNNVETLACIPVIINLGGNEFLKLGDKSGGGTKLLSITGHAKNRGVFEVPLGIPMQEILYSDEYAGGTSTGKPIQFCHFGGQGGTIGFEPQLHGKYSYDSLVENDLIVGTGSIVIMDYSVDIMLYLQKVLEFLFDESCGQCTPCRIGLLRILEVLERFVNKTAQDGDINKLRYLIENTVELSACGLGQSVGFAVLSCLRHRPSEFESRIGGLR